MDFLSADDFNGILSAGTLADLRGDNDKDLDKAEDLAISELDPLRSKFKITEELAKKDDNRNPVLVRIVINITAYYLYNSVPDDDIPERISDNYKKEIGTIEKIANGKLGSTLETQTDDDGSKITSFRMGSNKKRTHKLYPRN